MIHWSMGLEIHFVVKAFTGGGEIAKAMSSRPDEFHPAILPKTNPHEMI